MKKNMKKTLTLFMVTLVAFIFTFQKVNALEITEDGLYKNYNNILIKSEELENLRNLGFTEKQIELMDEEEFEANKNLSGEVLAEITKYYKTTTTYDDKNLYSINNTRTNIILSYSEEITEDEYNNSNSQMFPFGLTNGYTETNYKKMTTTIISVNNRYRYKNTLVWKNIPSTRSYDIIGIGIDSTVSGISSTKYFRTIADMQKSNDSYHQVSGVGTWKLSGTGYGVTFELPSDPIKDGYSMKGLESYMYFEVQKLTSAKILTLNAYGDYRHAQRTVDDSISYSFSIGTGGINFDASLSESIKTSYDDINTAQATLSGLNW